MDLIGSETTVTATRCAEVLGESVTRCSYHLGILGKYGYIELVPGQTGKEKPWQLVSRQQILDPSDLDTEGALAAEAAAGAFLDHELARIKQRLSTHQPGAGAVACGITSDRQHDLDDSRGTTRHHGPAKAACQPTHEERAADPTARPPGAREVRLLAVTSVAPPVTPSKDSAPQA